MEQVYPEGLQACGKAHDGAGEKCEEEGVAERSCHGLTIIPHTQASLRLWGVGGVGVGIGNEGVKLSLGKGSGKKVF